MKKKFILILNDDNSNNLALLKKTIDERLEDSISYLELKQYEDLLFIFEQHQPDCVVSDVNAFVEIDNVIEYAGHQSIVLPPMLIAYNQSIKYLQNLESNHIQYVSVMEILKSPFLLYHSIQQLSAVHKKTQLLEQTNQQFYKEMVLHEEAYHDIKKSHSQLQEAHQEIQLLLNDLLAAKEKIENSKKEADEASRYKTFFLAKMSHELRTPLNAVINFSDILRKELFGKMTVPKYKEYSEDIYNSSKYLLKLIDDLLNISRIEQNEIKLDYSKFWHY